MNVALRPDLPCISLCTGGGGLDRAVELAIPAARPIVCVEREAFAVASLVAQIENGLMAPAAVWSNVRTFPGRRFRGRVAGLFGGIPCQGHSLAGRRQGSLDERDLWSPARRIIAQARPWFVLIENVGGMLSAGADEVPGAFRVRRDLRKLGYQSTLVIVRADQMGLPHERLRVFILGVADWFVADGGGERDQRRGESGNVLRASGAPEEDGEQRQRRGCAPDGCGCGLGDTDCQRQRREGDGCEHPGALPAPGGSQLGDAECARRAPARGGLALDPGAEPQPRGRDVGDAKCPRPLPGAFSSIHCREEGDGARHGAPQRSSGGVADAEKPVEVVDAVGGGRDGRAQGALGEPERRSADERSGGRPFLRPPGPGDVEAWRHVAFVAPGLLPAVSRYDRLRLEMGAQGLVADGDPSAGTWLDAQTGERVHAAVVQAATQRALRGVADVMAPRIDELRMLGNGVADAQGALAVRIGAHDLAARGSAGAALLVRMMEAA